MYDYNFTAGGTASSWQYFVQLHDAIKQAIAVIYSLNLLAPELFF